MKRFLLLIVSFCFTLSACSLFEDEPIPDIKEDIILVNIHTNYAWGYTCNGSFIDNKGILYKFDLSDESGGEKDFSSEEIFEKLLDIQKRNNSEKTVLSSKELSEVYSLIQKLDKNAKYETNQDMFDFGQSTYYAVRNGKGNKPELITFYSYGDFETVYKDKNAEKLRKICENLMK